MANVAAQQLQALLDLRPERPEAEADEAGFATAPAIVTAIGATALLGPLAGLILGGAQGILGQRARQGELDRAAEEAEILAQSDEIAAAVFDSQRMAAASPADLRQLDVLQSQYAAASKMLRSDMPETRARGAQLMSEVMGAQRAYEVKNEEQFIAEQQRNEDGIRAMGEQAWSRFNTIAGDLQAESGAFIEQRAAYGRILSAAGRASPAGDIALVIAYMKVLDPGSVVREGEFATAQNAAGVPERIRATYNRMLNGERLTAKQRGDFVATAGALFKQAAEGQNDRNTRFMERARDAGVPERFLDTLPIRTGIKTVPVPQAPGGEDDPGIAEHAAAVAGTTAAAVKGIVDSPVGTGLAAAAGMNAAALGSVLMKLAPRLAGGLLTGGVLSLAFEETGPRREGESEADFLQRLERAARSAAGPGAFDPTGRRATQDRRPTN